MSRDQSADQSFVAALAQVRQTSPQLGRSTLLHDLQAKYAVLEAERDELKRDRDALLKLLDNVHRWLVRAPVLMLDVDDQVRGRK